MPLHQLIFACLFGATCLYAVARGGAPERIVACGFVTAFLLTNLLDTPQATTFQLMEWRIALVDGGLLAALLVVALCSTRYWAMPMASMQVVDVLGHVSKLLDPDIVPQAYYALVAFISFPMVLLLAVAVWFHRRRLARFGVDFAWVSQLPARYRLGWLAHERPVDGDAGPGGWPARA